MHYKLGILTYLHLQYISIHGNLADLLASDFSFDPAVNKKFHQVLWINPPTDADVLAGKSKAKKISITYQYGNNTTLTTKDFDAADDIYYSSANNMYNKNGAASTAYNELLKDDIELATNAHIAKNAIGSTLQVNMPVYYDVKEVKDVNLSVANTPAINLSDVANYNYLKFNGINLLNAAYNIITTPFDANIQTANVLVQQGSNATAARPIIVLTKKNQAHELSIGLHLARDGATVKAEIGTVQANANYLVCYIIDDYLSVSRITAARNGYVYANDTYTTFADVDVKLQKGTSIKSAMLEPKTTNYLLNTGYKLKITYEQADIKLNTYSYSETSKSLFGLKQFNNVATQDPNIGDFNEKNVKNCIELLDNDFQKFVLNTEFITPMEYYSSITTNALTYDSVIDDANAENAIPVYFWVETLKNWCTYEYEDVSSFMKVAKLKMWNGRNGWFYVSEYMDMYQYAIPSNKLTYDIIKRFNRWWPTVDKC